MVRFVALILFASALSSAQLVDRSQPLPQTPRQALLEVLQSKDGSAIERHLPEIAKRKFRETGNNGPTGFALMGFHGAALSGLLGHASGEKLEVFEAGPLLARIENSRTHEKFEIVIDNEDFRGNESDFELTFHAYKNGEETLRWYTPRILLNMKQESGIWRFAEVGFTIKLPLSNPEFLDAMSKQFVTGPLSAEAASAVSALRTLHVAEIQYASSYPAVGFTCSLADLGSGGAPRGTRKQPSQRGAMLIDDVLASGQKAGYQLAISNCGPPPVSRFTITAVPETSAARRRAYCTDESGVIRYSADGRAETCLTSGKVLE